MGIKNKIECAKLYLIKNFRESIELDRLAHEVGVSKFHFHREFKKDTGVTPLKFVNDIRLNHALHCLKMYPEIHLIDIAFECGYSSPSVFSRSFKKRFNSTPMGYKKRHHKEFTNSKISFPTDLPICYLNKTTFHVNSCNLSRDNLNNLFKNQLNENKEVTHLYGIFIDAPMHKKLENCKYYGGYPEGNQKALTYDLEEGYYTYFDFTGDFEGLIHKIVSFKEDRIDTSNFNVDSLIGFEKIFVPENVSNFDYFSVKRRIYIKIKRQ